MYKPIVIAGNENQFADWCRVTRTNPIAAVYVETEAALRAALLRSRDVMLWGDYRRNPAFRAFQANKAA